MVLGILATQGPRHGHQIRRAAEITNVGEWGGVSVGALYRELRTMDAEGLVTAVRTEQVGRPDRIGPDGERRALDQRSAAGRQQQQDRHRAQPGSNAGGLAPEGAGTLPRPLRFIAWTQLGSAERRSSREGTRSLPGFMR